MYRIQVRKYVSRQSRSRHTDTARKGRRSAEEEEERSRSHRRDVLVPVGALPTGAAAAGGGED